MVPGNYLHHRPILDREQRVVAHELSVERPRPVHATPWQAPARRLFAAALLWHLVHARLEALLAQRLVFLPVDISVLEHPALSALPRRNVVLHIAWHQEGPAGEEEKLFAGMSRLREMGFSLGCAQELLGSDERLAALADYIVVDAGASRRRISWTSSDDWQAGSRTSPWWPCTSIFSRCMLLAGFCASPTFMAGSSAAASGRKAMSSYRRTGLRRWSCSTR